MIRILTLVFVYISTHSYSQSGEYFEGVLYYSISYSSDTKEVQSLLAMLPKRSTLSVKEQQMRMEQEVAGGSKQCFILDAKNKVNTLLMNFMGREFQVKMTEEELMTLEQAKTYKLIYTDEKMVIAGEDCKLAYAVADGDTLKVWYAPNLKVGAVIPQFADLDGLPLIYEVKRGDLRMVYSCDKIARTTVPASAFELDSDVAIIPFSDFARTFAVSK